MGDTSYALHDSLPLIASHSAKLPVHVKESLIVTKLRKRSTPRQAACPAANLVALSLISYAYFTDRFSMSFSYCVE